MRRQVNLYAFMRLSELLNTCARSSPDDWNLITCWGARAGPSYLDQFMPGEYGGEFQVRHNEHSMRASYKPDVSVGIAWGLDPDNVFPEDRRTFKEAWSEAFADSSWTYHLADFFFCGNLVQREPFLAVDGGRCYLPAPHHDLTVTEWERDFFRVLDALEKHSDYDDYFGRAGFKIRPGG